MTIKKTAKAKPSALPEEAPIQEAAPEPSAIQPGPEAPDAEEPAPDAEEDYPGKNPEGSVTGECLDGTKVSIPYKTAAAISDWLESLPERSVPATARVYDEPPRIVVVAHPSPRKATFLL